MLAHHLLVVIVGCLRALEFPPTSSDVSCKEAEPTPAAKDGQPWEWSLWVLQRYELITGSIAYDFVAHFS